MCTKEFIVECLLVTLDAKCYRNVAIYVTHSSWHPYIKTMGRLASVKLTTS